MQYNTFMNSMEGIIIRNVDLIYYIIRTTQKYYYKNAGHLNVLNLWNYQ